MLQRFKSTVYCSSIIFATMVLSNQVSAQTSQEINADSRNIAECSVRATFLQFSIDAYSSQAWTAKFRSQQGAVDYVIEQTASQNLKAAESKILIRRVVKYVYDVLRPEAYSPNDVLQVKDDYYRRCMFAPKVEIGNSYIVDLKKAFSRNTDGEYIAQAKDGSRTVCSKGECKSQPATPPQNVGKSYADTRKVVQSLGWSPAPSEIKPILIRIGRILTNGRKTTNQEIYGNCLIENSTCDKLRPELADCTESGECTAVWSKDGTTIWYVIQNDRIVQYSSTPPNFMK